jgi:hypothetical protein
MRAPARFPMADIYMLRRSISSIFLQCSIALGETLDNPQE